MTETSHDRKNLGKRIVSALIFTRCLAHILDYPVSWCSCLSKSKWAWSTKSHVASPRCRGSDNEQELDRSALEFITQLTVVFAIHVLAWTLCVFAYMLATLVSRGSCEPGSHCPSCCLYTHLRQGCWTCPLTYFATFQRRSCVCIKFALRTFIHIVNDVTVKSSDSRNRGNA